MRFRKPKIGITLSEAEATNEVRWPVSKGFDYIKKEYYEAVLKSGGIPILLPNVQNRSDIKSFFGSINGLLLTGGVDVHPIYFNQEPHEKLSRTTVARDWFEIEIIRTAVKNDMPVLGICRGNQALNIALGGDLYQDLSCIKRNTLKHADPDQTGNVFHKVRIEKDSTLYDIVGKEVIEVNSSHHQVVDNPGKGLRPVAYASDSIIEGLEHTGRKFVISVQWHPEGIFSRAHSRKLFAGFVRAAAKNM